MNTIISSRFPYLLLVAVLAAFACQSTRGFAQATKAGAEPNPEQNPEQAAEQTPEQNPEAPSEEDADAAALKAAHAQLVNLLDQTDDLFYKAETDENGNSFYTVMWAAEGQTSRIVLGIKRLGQYAGKPIHGISAWAFVAGSDEPMPPAVIQAVAVASDSLAIGSYSCSSDLTKVYANMSGVLEGNTPGGIWMYCAYLHENRIALKEQVDQTLAGAGN